MALHASRWSHLNTKQSAYSEYTLEERAKMGSYGTKNGSSKVTKHFSFSLLLDGKLTCTCRLRRTSFFGRGTESPS